MNKELSRRSKKMLSDLIFSLAVAELHTMSVESMCVRTAEHDLSKLKRSRFRGCNFRQLVMRSSNFTFGLLARHFSSQR